METPDKNGYTKDGKVAGDYILAGRDPNLPRQSDQQIADAIVRMLRQQPPVRNP
jgi:hypothetical protein